MQFQTKKPAVGLAHTRLRFNEHLTLIGTPKRPSIRSEAVARWSWVIDRYKVNVDGTSGVVNDPNDWFREHQNPRYLVDVIAPL